LLFVSTLIDGAWAGRLLHLAGLDVIGSTAGSLSRFVQDREIELWESKRIVSEASREEVLIIQFNRRWCSSLTLCS
jgi:hypothetical protein